VTGLRTRFAKSFSGKAAIIVGCSVAALAAATPSSAESPVVKPSNVISISQIELNDEVNCLAQNIYFEARSEPVDGMLAVGHVVLNRVASKKFPDSVCKVVRQGGERRLNRCQFSWWCDGRSDEPRNKVSWNASRLIAWFVYNGQTVDPTGGALWYHAEYVKPYWRTAFVTGPQIGRHIFYLNGERNKLTGDRKRRS
jgi:spore germination cell wall hydrolase CwlJ-like protein